MARSFEREVDADRFTRLDRLLIAEQNARSEFADLRPDPDMLDAARQNRALLIERARKLERMGLASEVETGRWVISADAEPTLRELGERGDIIKALHRTLQREGLADQRSVSRYVVHSEQTVERIVGRVLDKGLASDELGERARLVIDGVDGRVHHLEMDAVRAGDVRPGMIVAAGSPPAGPRTADLNILHAAGADGVYRPSEHLEIVKAQGERLTADPDAFVRAHVRRLEALRRAGYVERVDADHWRVPKDLAQRGQAYDAARDGADIRVAILSPTPLDQQVRHDGATWLDRELLARQPTPLAEEGFGQAVQDALQRRRQELVRAGYLTDLGAGGVRAPKDLIQRLEAVEVERVGKALAAERGLEWHPAVAGAYVAGQLIGSTQLSSGRFAMIDDGLGFSLVPWREALEPQIGRHISGVAMPGGGVDWSFGRSRGLGL